MALHTLLLYKIGFSFCIVFHAEKMVPLLTFATKLQIARCWYGHFEGEAYSLALILLSLRLG